MNQVTVVGTYNPTTDTQAIFDAIDAMSGLGRGVVYLEGTFALRAKQLGTSPKYAAIQLVSNVDIVGVGNAKLKLVASDRPDGRGGHIFYGSGVTNVHIRNLEIDGKKDGTPWTLPDLANAADGEYGNGVYLGNCTDIVVEGNWIHSNNYHGVLAADACTRIHVDHNHINDNGYRAVHYNAPDHSPLTDSSINYNDVHNNGMASNNPSNSGIFASLGATFRLQCIGNFVRNEKAACIHIGGKSPDPQYNSVSREVNVSLNQTSGGTYGIYLTTGLINSTISMNTCSDMAPGPAGTPAGIQTAWMTGCKIVGNTIRRTQGGPAFFFGANSGDKLVDCLISGNIIDDNDGSTGVRCVMYFGNGNHRTCNITDNIFTNNGASAAAAYVSSGGGILIDNSGANRSKSMRISGNIFRDNRGNAVIIRNCDDTIIDSNQFMDNYDVSGRGRAIWVGGDSTGTKVRFNVARNDSIVRGGNSYENTLEQIYGDANTRDTRVLENDAESKATAPPIKFVTGATGRAFKNLPANTTWPAGFVID